MDMIEPRIVYRGVTRCIGQTLSMSVVQNRTAELWPVFAQCISDIKSDQYRSDLFTSLSISILTYSIPIKCLTMALVKVSNEQDTPNGMLSFVIEEGLWRFDYKGPSNDPSIYQYIYSRWMPNSIYRLDDRPHLRYQSCLQE